MEKYSELARCVENVEKDASKFFVNGNKAAGTRARKHLQELKQLAQDLRVLIQDTKNDKTRVGGAAAGHDGEQEDVEQHEEQAHHHYAQQTATHHTMHHHPQEHHYEEDSNANVGF